MPNASAAIEYLEESIGTAQAVLGEAEKLLSIADAAQRHAGAVAVAVRRTFIVVALGALMLAVVVAIRRRRRVTSLAPGSIDDESVSVDG